LRRVVQILLYTNLVRRGLEIGKKNRQVEGGGNLTIILLGEYDIVRHGTCETRKKIKPKSAAERAYMKCP